MAWTELTSEMKRQPWRSLPLGLACAVFGTGLRAADGWLDIDELSEVRVVSATRTEELAFTTPAAVHVITQDDIRRSGALHLADALRLAPGVEVGGVNSRTWAVTVRGFNGASATKVLPLIDGRSLYSMRFSGTIWDIRELMLEDIERIEVIGGPGGTMWGANAVNGVINVITKDARDTVGTLVTAGGGTFERAFGSVRYGAQVGEHTWLRIFGSASQRGDSEPVNLPNPNDAWYQTRTGFRLDSEGEAGRHLKLTGDFFFSEADQFVVGPDRARSLGGHFLARQEIPLGDESSLAAQFFYDGIRRDSGGALTDADVFDGEVQHHFHMGERNQFTLGANYRLSRLVDEAFQPGVTVAYAPGERALSQAGLFVQNQFAVVPERLASTVGIKGEYNDFTGWEPLPSFRLAWTPTERQTVWAATSRAIRIPSRSDYDSTQTASIPGAVLRSLPNRSLEPESVVAAELGYRFKPHVALSFDVTGFVHWYDDLHTTQTLTATPAATTSQRQEDGFGEAYGVELATVWQPAEWWHLQLAYTALDLQLHRRVGSNDAGFESAEGSSPQHQVSLRSSWNLGQRWELDAWFRHVAALKASARAVDAYESLDLRLAWRPDEHWELALVGQNLLEEAHEEFVFLRSRWAMPRGGYARITVRF